MLSFLIGAIAGATIAVLFAADIPVKLVLWALKRLGAQEISEEKGKQIDAILNAQEEGEVNGKERG